MAVPAGQLTSEAVNQLKEGIDLVLGRWSALQMAIQNEWGGRDTCQKAQQLPVDIYHWLTRPSVDLYVDELEDLLDDFMLSLNTEIDDGSIEEVADNLMLMHEECLKGNFASIGRLRQSVPTYNQHMQVVNGGEDDSDSTSSSGDESMEMADEPDQPSNISDMTPIEMPQAPVEAPKVDAWDESMEMADEPDPSSNISDITPSETPQAPVAAPKADEDGWTVVSSRKNKCSRKNNGSRP